MDDLHGEVKPPMMGESREPAAEESKESVDEELAEGTTAIVPMKVLMGKDGREPKEGDEIVLKVVALHGEEAEVAYAPEKSETKTRGGMNSSDEELDALDKESY